MSRLSRSLFLSFGILSLVLLMLFGSESGAGADPLSDTSPTAFSTVWKEAEPDVGLLSKIIELLTRELDGISKDAPDGSTEGQNRSALKRRVMLLREWLEIIQNHQILTRQIADLPKQRVDVEKQIETLTAQPLLSPPNLPTAEEYQTIKDALANSVRDREFLISEQKRRQQSLQEIPQRILQSKELAQNAQERGGKFSHMLETAPEDQQRVLTLRVGNADLERRVLSERILLWQLEEAAEKQLSPVRDRWLELSRLSLERKENYFGLYQEVLQQQQEISWQERTEALGKSQTSEENATTPQQKFFARLETRTTQSQANSAEFQQLKVRILAEISDQEKRLQADRQEMENLRDLVNQFGTEGPAASLLKATYHLIGQRRARLDQIFPASLAKRHAEIQTRRVEISRQLDILSLEGKKEGQRLMESLPDRQRPMFEKKMADMLEKLRKTLTEEKQLAFEIGVEWQRLALLPKERRLVLEALEGIVLAHVFWIQEHEPLDLALIKKGHEELFSLANPQSLWNLHKPLVVAENWTRWSGPFQRTSGFAVAGTGLVLLTILAFFLRRRWQRALSADVEEKRPFSSREMGYSFLLVGLHSAAYPVVFITTAALINATDIPEDYQLVLFRFCWLMAVFFFAWSVGKWIYKRKSTLSLDHWLARDRVETLASAWRWVLFSGLAFLLPYQVFSQSPFDYQAVPRLLFTVFEFSAAIALFLLIRPTSPFFQSSEAEPISKLSDGHWPWFRRSLLISLGTILALDVMGYRFAAGYLATKGGMTIVTIVVLWILFGFLRQWVEQWKPSLRGISPEQRKGAVQSRRENVMGVLRFLIWLLGLVLLISLWGIDEQALAALKQINLYSVGVGKGKIEFVTVADLIRFVMVLSATLWFMAKLPVFFDWLVFSNWSVSEGSRYAVVTISRYVLFLVGFFVAVSWLRLDLTQIGWLVAAISVGLGFGLQEIVANFVSGIILLLERPIRVGDVIAVGSIQGKVTRVNIRATTIQNWDLQEILIPNKDLITKEVTNWTLSNTRLRLVLSVRVAYGTPVAKVREVLLGLARQQPEILSDPAPELFFIQYGESSLNFELRIFLPRLDLRLLLLDRMNTLIGEAFAKEGIVIPFPQQDLHIYPSQLGDLKRPAFDKPENGG